MNTKPRRTSQYLLSSCLLLLPIAAPAADDHSYTDPEKIKFDAATRAALDRNPDRVRHYRLRGGVLLAEHGEMIGSMTVARRGTDGHIETLCTTDERAARAWMSGAPGTAPVITLELEPAPVTDQGNGK